MGLYPDLSTLASQSDPTTRRVFKSLVVITLVVICGWSLNSGVKIVLNTMGVDSFGQFLDTVYVSYLVSIASTVNAPVLYAFSSEYRRKYKAEWRVLTGQP